MKKIGMIMMLAFSGLLAGCEVQQGNRRAAEQSTSQAVTEISEESAQKVENTVREEVRQMTVTVGDQSFTADLEHNEAVNELIEMMRKSPVTISLSDYSGFEKVGSLGRSLTASNSRTTTKSGDITVTFYIEQGE